MILETFERWRRGRNWGYGFAIIAFIVAFAVRYGLEDLLPPGLPFLTFFPAVILTSFFAGVGPAVLVTALSVLAAWYFFLPQLQSFNIESDSVIALVLYVFINALIILLVHTLNVAIERLREERGKARALADQSEAMFISIEVAVRKVFSFFSPPKIFSSSAFTTSGKKL